MWFRSKGDRDWRRALREFIYLDEVSVTSLLAARDGEIPETVSDTLSRTAEAESTISVAGPVKALKLGAESRTKATDTTAQEVVRRAVIQSTFRRLHTGGHETQRPFGDSLDRVSKFDGSISSLEDLQRKARRLIKAGTLRPLGCMRRGDLVEFEVTLRPARTFIAAHAIESFARMMTGRPQLFGDAAFQIKQAEPMAEILNDMMVGLVPVRGVSTNFSLMTIGGDQYLVDTRLFAAGSNMQQSATPIELVALTDFASYWKDLRRVLYSGNRFTMFARLASSQLRPNWTPLKLSELLGDVSHDVRAAFVELENVVDAAFKGGVAAEAAIDLRGMMHAFADALPGEVPPDRQTEMDDAISVAVAIFKSAADTSGEWEAFDRVVEAHEMLTKSLLDRTEVARIRNDVIIRSAALNLADATSEGPNAEAPPQLEVEVVAIYW